MKTVIVSEMRNMLGKREWVMVEKGIDLATVIAEKMAINEQRGTRGRRI